MRQIILFYCMDLAGVIMVYDVSYNF